MLDGIQGDSNYPPDFFVDFVFEEIEEEVKEKEEKDKVWLTIAKDCEERRKLIEDEDILFLHPEDVKRGEEDAFVIESDEVMKAVVEEEKVSSLEEEAIRMHKELLKDSDSTTYDNKPMDINKVNDSKSAKDREDVRSKEDNSKTEKKEGKEEDDKDLDIYLAGVNKMIGK